MSDDTVAISELLEILPDRVDAVSSPANGTEWLILKALDNGEVTETEATLEGAVDEVGKADAKSDDRPACKTCDGNGKIMAGNRKCPDCKGTGKGPMVGESAKSYLEAIKEAGAAASGSGPTPADNCGTCKGTGAVGPVPNQNECPDCGGTGKDQATTNASELKMVDGDPGKITEGAGGRETVDKALEERYPITEAEYVAKRDMDPNTGGGVDRDKIPAEDFAGKDRSFPIVKPGDVSDAASSIGRAGDANYSSDKLKANIIAIAKRKGAKFVAELPDAWKDGAEKASGDPTVYTAPNATLASMAVAVTGNGDAGIGDGGDGDAAAPGSPAWEAVDADTATQAALALMAASELIRAFAQREAIEVAAGEGNDIFDTFAATDALCAAQAALGIMSQMAFHEGLEAAKGLADDETVEKAGKRLAGRTVSALAAARDKAKELSDHLTGVLGDDDPDKQDKDGAEKSFAVDIDLDALSKEIEDMTTDELTKLLDARDEKLVGTLVDALGHKAKKGKSAKDQTDSVASAKDAKAGADAKDPKADDDDLEDEAEQGDGGSASGTNQATGAAKSEAELTPEELEAKQARKEAKKALKAAEQAEKQAAENAALTKAIEEATAEVREANAALQDRLAQVEKMAAPSTIVRTPPQEAATKASRRDELDLRLATVEREARDTTDQDIRKARREEAREIRNQLASL